ncbi:uncharacterized protein BCR38DRAFT_351986 [Pseudomassariella vexata]|uniref:RING-type domain-containing protein n=1 Tax=Pseudomassariella vexata TaxID=1141098 RepID=A0A1Y2DJ83_9PEZI|nr:uncharacterized protein BCR38DRAFT_351986 [Pseudomassariella vexata]ORY59214.1 hypothetical protein BCR38DRAFT_351986 [Pseudomassariella vexata]
MQAPAAHGSKRSRAAVSSTPGSFTRRQSSASSQSRRIKPLKSLLRRTSRGGDDDDVSPFDTSPATRKAEDDVEVLDLSEATEVSKELLQPKVDNRVKLSKFNCVICMDDVSNLTVTHCGHLFCSECLHSALHIDSNKKSCPVCRQKVEIKNKTKKTDARSYYHLELKLMTAKRKEKRPAA